MELLLLSNSTLPGEAYFEWPKAYVDVFLSGRKRVAFVPFAAVDDQQDAYTLKVNEAFASSGAEFIGLHREKDPIGALGQADTVVVGGGNSFLLLRALYRTQLIKHIANKVRDGMPYMGWSAGSNITCPTIMTTNDMPIVEVPSMRGMHLMPFQINPHYTEATIPGHGGESRDQRIAEFLATNPSVPVVGLREGSLLKVGPDGVELHGRDMMLFRQGKDPVVVKDGAHFRRDLSDL